MSPVRLGKRFATGHRGDLSVAMVCREMCCEMKISQETQICTPIVNVCTNLPPTRAVRRLPGLRPWTGGRTLAHLVITIADKGEKEPVSNYYDKRHGYGGVRGGTCGRLLR